MYGPLRKTDLYSDNHCPFSHHTKWSDCRVKYGTSYFVLQYSKVCFINRRTKKAYKGRSIRETYKII